MEFSQVAIIYQSYYLHTFGIACEPCTFHPMTANKPCFIYRYKANGDNSLQKIIHVSVYELTSLMLTNSEIGSFSPQNHIPVEQLALDILEMDPLLRYVALSSKGCNKRSTFLSTHILCEQRFSDSPAYLMNVDKDTSHFLISPPAILARHVIVLYAVYIFLIMKYPSIRSLRNTLKNWVYILSGSNQNLSLSGGLGEEASLQICLHHFHISERYEMVKQLNVLKQIPNDQGKLLKQGFQQYFDAKNIPNNVSTSKLSRKCHLWIDELKREGSHGKIISRLFKDHSTSFKKSPQCQRNNSGRFIHCSQATQKDCSFIYFETIPRFCHNVFCNYSHTTGKTLLTYGQFFGGSCQRLCNYLLEKLVDHGECDNCRDSLSLRDDSSSTHLRSFRYPL